MLQHKINHYCTYNIKKAAIVERVIRILKSNLFKKFSLLGKYKWWNILSDITYEYNNKKCRATRMKPVDV